VAWFVKTETFTAKTLALTMEQRRPFLEAHRNWLDQEIRLGRRIRSGFLVDEQRRPGGGGLLMFQASSHADALEWVSKDPMIVAGLVVWQLQEWIPVTGDDWP
jgi:uncharacterized protein YciI